MKINTIIMTLALGSLSLASIETYGQYRTESTRSEAERLDSASTMYRNEQVQQTEQDAERLADVKKDRRETKAKAKEARRVEQEASDAARESKYALRAEKRAQKSRKDADKQAQKANRARIRSDKNE
jgi:hypothetical protein